MGQLGANRKLKASNTATVLGGINFLEIIDFLGAFGFDAMCIETEHRDPIPF